MTANPISKEFLNTKKNSLSINSLKDKQANIKFDNSLALHQCILDGRIKQVKYLLKFGANVNYKDVYGRSCLMLACLSDHEDYGCIIANILLKYNANVNTQDYMGRTALSIACTENRLKLLELFLNKNLLSVNFLLKDNDGNALINQAAICNNPRIIELLVEKISSLRIHVDQRNNMGYTAFLLVSINLG